MATECLQRRATKLEKQGWKAKAFIGWSVLEKKRLKEDFPAHCSFLWRGNEEGSADLFSLVLGNRTRGNGAQLHMWTFRLDTRKNFFIERVLRLWNGIPREVVDAPRLLAFKRHLSNALNNML